MNCPKCAGESAVNNSRPDPKSNYVRRYRVCKVCDFRWKTLEAIVEKENTFETHTMGMYEAKARELGQLVEEKQKAYGDSFSKAGEFLKLLYPNGIEPEQYTDALCLVRIFDKQMRIATKKDAFGESPYGDLVGYSLLGLVKDEKGR
ncbi:hypothetical protein [Aneurinibacillus migulanus]|uniref:NrdR family transcriptional regulator n=1 Tax=Aneurinibacillus migulanus TaxID=47500 RepID=UPI00209F5C0E|nr:hypothetical protein [Aneurinibacillus migulanus]MCP1355064.1 hypothetical protein [Aneurinibacillus migulanus]